MRHQDLTLDVYCDERIENGDRREIVIMLGEGNVELLTHEELV